MKRLYGKTWAKLLAWMLLILSLAASCIFALIAYLNLYEYKAPSFFDSRAVRKEMRMIAGDCVVDVYENTHRQRPADNAGWQVVEFRADKADMKTVAETRIPASYTCTVSYDYCFLNESSIVVLEESENMYNVSESFIETNRGSESCSFGKIHLFVSEPQKADDFFDQKYEIWKKVYPYQNSAVWIICAALAAALFSMIFIFCSAGHSDSDSSVHMIWADRIPIEIAALVIAGISGSGYLLIRDAGYLLDSWLGAGDAGYLFAGAFWLIISFLLALGGLLSLKRRVMSGSLASTSLLVKGADLLFTFCSMIPYVLRVAFVSLVLFLLNAAAVMFVPISVFHPVVIILDFLFMAAVIVYAFYTRKLKEKTALLAKGDLDQKVSEKKIPAPAFYKEISDDLDQISEGISAAVEKQMRSERLRTELITNVSHDIRTPLTSIISYADLLSREEDPEKQKEYIDTLLKNGNRLRKLSEDLIEASKASTGNIHAELAKTDVKEIIQQSLGEYEEKLSAAGLTPVFTMYEEPLYVNADGRLLWRVLSNLLSNCVKYAQPGTRVYIDAKKADDMHVSIIVKNISKDILNITSDELIERFVRGDAARSSEGSGLGLNIAKSLCEVMKGSFELTVDGDLFKAEILLSAAE